MYTFFNLNSRNIQKIDVSSDNCVLISIESVAMTDYGVLLRECFGDLDITNIKHAITYACTNADVEVLRWITSRYNVEPIIIQVLERFDILSHDSVEFMQFLVNDLLLYVDVSNLLPRLCHCDCVNMIDYLTSCREIDIVHLAKIACEYDSLSVMEYIFSRYTIIDIDEIFQFACRFANPIAKWLVTRRPNIHANQCCAFINASQCEQETDCHANVRMFVNISVSENISYHYDYDGTKMINYIVSMYSMGDIWNHTVYIKSYNLYVYSSHSIVGNPRIDFTIYGVYASRLHQARG